MSNVPEPIILRTPVAVVQSNTTTTRTEAPLPAMYHHFDKITRVFSWMTAAFLSAAIVVALISGSLERNDLRNQISKQATELICRTRAQTDVAKANAARDSTIGRLVVAVSKNNQVEVDRLTLVLEHETDAVDGAIAAQEEALKACSGG